MTKTKPIRNEAKWPDARISINNIFKWSPLLGGSIKFNTDGVVAGSFEATSLGGCLFNEKGKFLIYFSKYVGFTAPTSAELLAILEACRLSSNSIWSHYVSLTLEYDSKLAVEWLMQPHKAPELIPRDFNLAADHLAKNEISR
ncbi:hypothetical protein GQ457_10G016560 [Hibiscus cannabinus]